MVGPSQVGDPHFCIQISLCGIHTDIRIPASRPEDEKVRIRDLVFPVSVRTGSTSEILSELSDPLRNSLRGGDVRIRMDERLSKGDRLG